jgi:hypothetical protein
MINRFFHPPESKTSAITTKKRRYTVDENVVKEYLLKHNEMFRTLAEEHQRYEEQLEHYTNKPFLNSEEQLQETVLKKKKLALKDQMQILISQHQMEGQVH